MILIGPLGRLNNLFYKKVFVFNYTRTDSKVDQQAMVDIVTTSLYKSATWSCLGRKRHVFVVIWRLIFVRKETITYSRNKKFQNKFKQVLNALSKYKTSRLTSPCTHLSSGNSFGQTSSRRVWKSSNFCSKCAGSEIVQSNKLTFSNNAMFSLRQCRTYRGQDSTI